MFYIRRSDLVLNLKGGVANQFYAFSAFNAIINLYNLSGQVNISSLLSSSNPRDFGLLKLFSLLGIDNFDERIFVSKPYIPYISKLIQMYPICESLYRRTIADEQSNVPLTRFRSRKYLMDSYYINHLSIINGGLLQNYTPQSSSNFNSIAIHFRLGDYINSKNRLIYPTISTDYILQAYFKCLSHPLFDKSLPCKLDIFSDSPERAIKTVTSINFPDSVDINLASSDDPIIDLIRLASYPFKILSASTYSLLSYYLGQSKCTVLPSKWFLDRPTSHLIFPPADFNGLLYLLDL